MGIDWGEYRPGRQAVLIANFANEPNTFLGLDDARRLLFSDAALSVGLAGPSAGRSSSAPSSSTTTSTAGSTC